MTIGSSQDPDEDDEDDARGAPEDKSRVLSVALPETALGERLDRALAGAVDPAEGVSRSRLRSLIEQGRLSAGSGETLREPSAKVKAAGIYRLAIPAPAPAAPQPEAIPLEILFEDAALLVVNKPPGMATHPAPGSETGTLVNAVLAHCGDSLSGVGGEARPGVVHRIDKETSGLLVLAKTDYAHQALSRQFADHSIERAYRALVWGAPDRADARLAGLEGLRFAQREPEDPALWGRIETEIGRSRSDRKKMAVLRSGGRRAVTWFRALRRFGAAAALIECRLETGRTHQIRVHMAYAGFGLIGDPLYGRASASRREALGPAAREAAGAFRRQALHAERLGFVHPLSGAPLRFQAPPPEDFAALEQALGG